MAVVFLMKSSSMSFIFHSKQPWDHSVGYWRAVTLQTAHNHSRATVLASLFLACCTSWFPSKIALHFTHKVAEIKTCLTAQQQPLISIFASQSHTFTFSHWLSRTGLSLSHKLSHSLMATQVGWCLIELSSLTCSPSQSCLFLPYKMMVSILSW